MSTAARLGVKFVFAALVVATLTAFFVAQRLKGTLSVVREVEVVPKRVSPNGDGRNEHVRIFFRLRKPDNVTATIVNGDDEPVRGLIDDKFLLRDRHSLAWDGRDASGSAIADGTYFLRIGLRREGRTATSPTKIYVDTRPPHPFVASVAPNVLRIVAGRRLSLTRKRVRVRLHGPTRTEPVFSAYRIRGERAQLIARFHGRAGAPIAYWNGLRGKQAAPQGRYLIAVEVRDAAGNRGSSPAELPPRSTKVRGHPQLRIRHREGDRQGTPRR